MRLFPLSGSSLILFSSIFCHIFVANCNLSPMPVKNLYSLKRYPLQENFREKALNFAAGFPFCSYLTNNKVSYPESPFPEILAVGTTKVWNLGDAPFDELLRLHKKEKSWLFGYFTYELKNRIHGLTSKHQAKVNFPPCSFFRPDFIIFFHLNEVEIGSCEISPDKVFTQILNSPPAPLLAEDGAVKLQKHMPKEEYLEKVETIRKHIFEGDFYEFNFCQEFTAAGVSTDPLSLFLKLNKLSPSPFAAFLRFQNLFLICASPERFLKKEGSRLVSQPIKGTIRRGTTPAEDVQLKQRLRQDEKELAENMMITDLVRNDLAMSCRTGTVKVEEMFGIYSFKQLHQMISTVSGLLRPEVPFTEAIKNAFPMGSMTGAPKKKVMELIDLYENSARGLYSGSTGYISPEGDFDFNVVIRSMLFDQKKNLLSFQAGGAITYDSVPEKEYEECLLKAKAMLEVLGHLDFPAE